MWPRVKSLPLGGCCGGTNVTRFLLLLLCLWSWNVSYLLSPNLSTQEEVEIEIPKAAAHSPSFSAKCFDGSISKNCTQSNTKNRTVISPDFDLTSKQQTVTPLEEGRYRHPNFTFDFPLCFVHVGKTAGSSISCGLGLTYADCEGMPRQPALPHTDYFHMRKNNCHRNDEKGQGVATLLMTVRNPLTRIQSWFNFEKEILPIRKNKQAEERLRWQRGMLFSECYDNFMELVTEGLEPPRSLTNNSYEISTERPINMTCRERAWAAILGVREFSYHEWFNYEHYWEGVKDILGKYSRSPLLVLRTEHLLEDWSQLSKEDLFRQVNKGSRSSLSVNFTMNPSISNTSHIFGEAASANDFSSRFWLNLCHAMCPEILIYKEILDYASNLNDSQVRESIFELQVLCPQYNSRKRNCPAIPQFPLIKVSRKRYFTETKKRLFVIR